jgi:adenylosuccinate synthase
VDSVTFLHSEVSLGSKVLVEGANAALLDVDFGSLAWLILEFPASFYARSAGIAQVQHGTFFRTNAFITFFGCISSSFEDCGNMRHPSKRLLRSW